MDGVFADDELNANTGEGTLQVVVGGLHILRTHVDGVWVKFGQNLRDGFFDE